MIQTNVNRIYHNKFVEVLNKDHGREVMAAWKSLGVDSGFQGKVTKEEGAAFRYYGIKNNDFSNYKLKSLGGLKIITLQQLRELKPINKILDLDNFMIKTGGCASVYKEFINLCKIHNIKYSTGFQGGGNYYGIENKKVNSHINFKYVITDVFTIEEFKQQLLTLNKQTNEKISSITTRQRITGTGKCCISRTTRQISIRSRYFGNKTSSRIKKTRIGVVKKRPTACSR